MSDLAAVRQFLQEHLTSAELEAICLDYFRDVYNEFAPGMTNSQRIQLLLDYCDKRGRLDSLLAAVRRVQPEMYRRYLAPQISIRLPEEPPPVVRQPRISRQIFVSHAHQDAALAQRLAADLRARGWPVWIAPDSIRPGEKWVEAINRGLDESGIFVVLLTPAAVASRWVISETNVAVAAEHQGEMRFLPVVVQPCRPPALWRSYQRISLQGNYRAGLASLLAELDPAAAANGKRLDDRPPAGRLAMKRLAAWLKALPAAVWIGGGLIIALIIALALLFLGLLVFRGRWSLVVSSRLPMAATPIATQTRLGDGMVMVYVPEGSFLMGSADSDPDAYDSEFPQHQVTLDAFWLDQTEVTNGQYERCVADGECRANYDYGSDFTGENQPVVGVSWDDAADYCAWAGGQLPTEAQWEYAARGPESLTYPWGDSAPDLTLLNYDWNVGRTTDVGSYPAGASWVGVLDMAGNVYEWVADWYDADYYDSSPVANPAGPTSGETKVLRGGSWRADARSVRGAYRLVISASVQNYIGFRCLVPQG